MCMTVFAVLGKDYGAARAGNGKKKRK